MSTRPGDDGVDDGFGSLQIKRASTAEQVAEALRQMILRGEVEQGQPLREVALAASIGISRNTMREAIRVLAREGIVTHHMHRGAVVTRLDARDVEDIFRVRRVLELASVEATLTAEPEQLAGLAGAVHELEVAARAGDWGGIIDADELFHERLVGLLGSRRLSRLFDAVQAEIRLCMSIVNRSSSDTDALVAEHRELLRLIAGRELDRCAQVMGGHLADAEEMLKLLVAEGSQLPADRPHLAGE
jgi:DNA-binding GntR family transcriptional regulator